MFQGPQFLLLLAAASCKAASSVSILIQYYISFCEKTGPNIRGYYLLFFDDLLDCNFGLMFFYLKIETDWPLVRLFVDVNMLVLITC